MYVNIVDYQATEDSGGTTYTVVLEFIYEDGGTETERDLGIDQLRLYRMGPGDIEAVKTGTDPLVLPEPGSVWSGVVAGSTLDAANANAILSEIDYGQFDARDQQGIRYCLREVTLSWAPETSPSATQPPNTSEGNDPDAWFPEYSRKTQAFQELRPLKFLGYLPRTGDPLAEPVTSTTSGLLSTPSGPEIGKTYEGAKNSLGQVVRPVQNINVFGYVDTFLEYGTQYHDAATNLADRMEVVNERDLIVKVATNGITVPDTPVKVKYPKGSAMVQGYAVSSRIYRYVNPTTQAVVYVPYFVRTTEIAVKATGWALRIPNVAELIKEPGENNWIIPHAQNGPVRQQVFIDRFGEEEDFGTLPGSMCYGMKENDFSGIIGATTVDDPVAGTNTILVT